MSDPTTTNIPTTDPALLAAQAKAGQAGVDAYNAAISTLQQQRQQAVQSATASAAARGLSTGAEGGDVGRMYDSRISQMQEGLGQFQANTAARGQRLADYNAAVGSARTLIPGQVNIATAPIKAQGEFDVWKIGAEGRQKVDAINAQKELVAAQMEAAKLAAASRGGGGGGGRGGGGGGGKTISEGNLKSGLAAGAQEALAPYQQAAQQGGDVSAAPGVEGDGTQGLASRADANWRSMAANYAGQAMQEYNQKQAQQAAQQGGGKGLLGILKAAAGIRGNLQKALPEWAQQAARNTMVDTNQDSLANRFGGYNQARQRALNQIVLAPTLPTPSTSLRPSGKTPGQAAQEAASAMDRLSGEPNRTSFPTISLPGMYEQASGVGRTGSRDTVAEMLGQPYRQAGGNNDMIQAPGSADVLRQAMYSAIPQLQKAGYKVSDEAVLNVMADKNGIYHPGDTLADMLARQEGVTAPKDAIQKALDDADSAAKTASTPAAMRAAGNDEKQQKVEELRDNFSKQKATAGMSLQAVANAANMTEASVAEATAAKDFGQYLLAVTNRKPKMDKDVEAAVRTIPDPYRQIIRAIMLGQLPSAEPNDSFLGS